MVLPRLESDIFEIFWAVANKTPMPLTKWYSDAVIGFVLASKGYPGSYKKGFEIRGVDEVMKDPSVKVYHMGTSLKKLLVLWVMQVRLTILHQRQVSSV